MQFTDLPRRIPLAFADGGTKNVIPEAASVTPGFASLTTGFPAICFTPILAGGIPPAGADFNGIFNFITAIQRWQCAGGQFTYNSTFASDSNVGGYPQGAYVLRADGTGFWLNATDDNSTNPDTGGAGWVPGWNYGFTSVAMASTNVTLTAVQASKDTIIITGTLTASVNLVFPVYTKKWTVINKATGAYSVTCKTAGGTGIAVATGYTAVLYGDGTNILDTTLVSRSELTSAIAAVTLAAFPIGAVYLSANNVNPGTFLGGTWGQIAQGRAIVGVGTGNDGTNTQAFPAGNDSVGEYKHTLITAEMPSHTHNADGTTLYGPTTAGYTAPSPGADIGEAVKATSATGGGGAHNNIQPSFGLYVWQRTA